MSSMFPRSSTGVLHSPTGRFRAMTYLVTGGAGFLGSRIVAELQRNGVSDIFVPRSAAYDLRTEDGVRSVLADARPGVVIHAAALAGGSGQTRCVRARCSTTTPSWVSS